MERSQCSNTYKNCQEIQNMYNNRIVNLKKSKIYKEYLRIYNYSKNYTDFILENWQGFQRITSKIK